MSLRRFLDAGRVGSCGFFDPGGIRSRRLIGGERRNCVFGFVGEPAEIALDDERLSLFFLFWGRQPFTTATGLSFATFFERPSS